MKLLCAIKGCDADIPQGLVITVQGEGTGNNAFSFHACTKHTGLTLEKLFKGWHGDGASMEQSICSVCHHKDPPEESNKFFIGADAHCVCSSCFRTRSLKEILKTIAEDVA